MDTRVLIALVGLLGCEKRSTLYCAKNPEDLANCERMDAPIRPPMTCGSNADCMPPFCELGAGICVGCLVDPDCPSGERCDPISFTCKGCVEQMHCPSQACLPDGTCGTDDSVLYVDPLGDNINTCTQLAKCQTIARALALVTTTRRYIKLSGALTESVLINTKDVTIIADPGTTLTGVVGPDWVIKIQKSQVQIYGLIVTCGGGADQTGVKTEMDSTTVLSGMTITGCGRGGGVEAKGGFVNVTRSTIADNPAGGIQTDGAANFSITNNFIHDNGTTTSMWGGVWLDAEKLGDEQRFEFNTVVDNPAVGVKCKGAIPTNNSIIARNGLSGLVNSTGCDATGSLVTADITPIQFRAPDATPPDYHLGADSSAKDSAPVMSSVMEDFDGEFRPLEAGKDFGADEYRMP